jgi:membrane-bound lytic murein transglycosylase D
MMKDEEEREIFAFTPLQEEKKIESPPTAPRTPEELPTALQEAPGPKADDQLVDLWQKDFDKAVQQPAERRQIEFSMPVVENDRVRYFIDFFRARTKDFFERALARSGRYIPMMATILRDEGLPEDLVYLSLIESGFSPHAYSRAHAVGPWQFIRGTGLRYGLKINWWIDERRDPVKSTHAAAAYLKDLHLQFGEWFLAAAAYNAGERKVEKAVNRSKTNDFWRLSQKTYLKQETRNYIPKFIAAAIIARDPEKHGFGDVLYESPMEYDEVTLTSPLTLKTAADLADTTVDAIKELNPALLRGYTPPSEDGLLPNSDKVKFLIHRVTKGETLQAIAKRYGQRVNQLMEINSLKTQRIREGQELTVMFDGALPPAPASKRNPR